jgi:DNA-binding MarR family transcriptional regulator
MYAEVAAALRLAVGRMHRQLRQEAEGSLSLSQWAALATIEQLGPMRIGDIAERENVSAPTATRLVASLEELGLITRTADESDRRSSQVTVTDAGREQLRAARAASNERLTQRMSRLPDEDVRRIFEVLPVLDRLIDS